MKIKCFSIDYIHIIAKTNTYTYIHTDPMNILTSHEHIFSFAMSFSTKLFNFQFYIIKLPIILMSKTACIR